MPIGKDYDWFKYGEHRLSQYNQFEPVQNMMPNLPKQFKVRDLTMKSHVSGVCLNVEEMFKIAEKDVEAGIPELDCGRIYVQRDREVMKRCKEAGLDKKIRLVPSVGEVDVPEITLNKEHYIKWIDTAFEYGATAIKILWESGTMTAPPLRPKEHLLKGLPIILDVINYVHNKYKTDVSFSCADNTRLDLHTTLYVHKKLVEGGIDRIWISDEGYSNQTAFKWLVGEYRRVLGNDTPFIFHVHDTWGLAAANTIAGIEAAGPPAPWADLAWNGYGDHAGITEIVLALEFLYGIDTGIKLEKLCECDRLAEEVTGIPTFGRQPHTGKEFFIDSPGEFLPGVGYMHEIAEKEFNIKASLPPKEFWATGFDPSIIGAPKENKLAWSGGKGVISMNAMKSALKELGLRSTDEEAEKMINWIEEEVRKEITVKSRKRWVGWDEFVEKAKSTIPKEKEPKKTR